MDLNHRLVSSENKDSWKIAMHRIRYPLGFFIPAAILFLSFFTVRSYFGQTWRTGLFSTAIIPGISQFTAGIIQNNPEIILGNMILFIYALAPMTYYLFVFFLTKRHLPAVLVGLLSILPKNPFSASVSERLSLAIADNDGAHIMALTILPLAASLYLFYLKKGNLKYLLIFSLLVGFISSISFFSLHILFIIMFFIFISELLIGESRLKIKRFLYSTLCFVSIGLVIYNVSLWQYLVSDVAQTSLAVLINLLPLLFFLVPVIGTFAFLIFDRRPHLQPLFITLFLSLIFGLLHFVRISFVDIPVMDQDRYVAETSVFFYTLLGIFITWIFDILRAGKFMEKKPKLFAHRTKIAFLSVGIIILGICALILFIPRNL